MAEAIGLASGLLTLATFAFESSVALYESIKSFNSHQSRVRELLEELEALTGVLGPLTDIVDTSNGAELSTLDIPLLRCGKACKEFEQELMKCLSRSGANRTSFRDWAKLRYMSDDIDGFRRLLAGYKLTINIALTDATLRKSTVTAETLENHKILIETAQSDLEAHLESIDEKLERILGQTVAESESDTTELQLMKEERLSTEKCLQICARLSEHIDQLQLSPKRSSSSGSLDPDSSPEEITNQGLQDCKESLMLTAAKLERHMRDLMDRMLTKSRTAVSTEEEFADLERLRDEWETARQCIDICSKAGSHIKENASTIDNYATGDAVQFMVSTNGKIIHGKNRGLGWRTRQVGGYLSDVSVQQLSRDMTSINFRSTGNEDPSSREPTVPAGGVEAQPTPDYRERYGQGYKLSPKPSPDGGVSSTEFIEARQSKGLKR